MLLQGQFGHARPFAAAAQEAIRPTARAGAVMATPGDGAQLSGRATRKQSWDCCGSENCVTGKVAGSAVGHRWVRPNTSQ
jgi:hypothetical protein